MNYKVEWIRVFLSGVLVVSVCLGIPVLVHASGQQSTQPSESKKQVVTRKKSGTSPVKPCQPDLIPLSLKKTAAANGKTTLTIVIKNQGCGAAGYMSYAFKVESAASLFHRCEFQSRIASVDRE